MTKIVILSAPREQRITKLIIREIYQILLVEIQGILCNNALKLRITQQKK